MNVVHTTVDVTPMQLATIPLVPIHAPVKMDLLEMEPIALVFILLFLIFLLHTVTNIIGNIALARY